MHRGHGGQTAGSGATQLDGLIQPAGWPTIRCGDSGDRRENLSRTPKLNFSALAKCDRPGRSQVRRAGGWKMFRDLIAAPENAHSGMVSSAPQPPATSEFGFIPTPGPSIAVHFVIGTQKFMRKFRGRFICWQSARGLAQSKMLRIFQESSCCAQRFAPALRRFSQKQIKLCQC